MILIGAVAWGGGALLLALSPCLPRGGDMGCLAAATAFYAFGHPLLIEADMRRRGLPSGGCFIPLAVALAPPAGTCFYLIAAYRSKAAVLIPLYVGLLSASVGLGWGLGQLLKASA